MTGDRIVFPSAPPGFGRGVRAGVRASAVEHGPDGTDVGEFGWILVSTRPTHPELPHEVWLALFLSAHSDGRVTDREIAIALSPVNAGVLADRLLSAGGTVGPGDAGDVLSPHGGSVLRLF